MYINKIGGEIKFTAEKVLPFIGTAFVGCNHFVINRSLCQNGLFLVLLGSVQLINLCQHSIADVE